MADRPLTNEDTLAMLRKRAIEKNSDAFRIKVYRKKTRDALPESAAIFNDTTVLALANPEQWMPDLFGGGPHFKIDIYDNESTSEMIGTLAYTVHGEPKAFDPKVLQSKDWKGPLTCEWDVEKPQREKADKASIGSYQVPAMSVAPGGIAPPNIVPTGGHQQPSQAIYPEYLAAQRALEYEKSELQDAKRRLEMETMRIQNEARMRDMELQLKHAQSNASQSSGPKQSAAAEIAAVIASLSPLVTQIVSSQNDMRMELLRQQVASQSEQSKLLHTVLERRTEDGPGLKMMNQVTEMMSGVVKFQGEMMQQMRDQVLGPEESPMLKVVKEVSKGFAALASGPPAGVPRLPQPQGMAGLPAQAQARPAAKKPRQITAVDRLEHQIRAHIDVNVVVSDLLAAQNDPDFQRELEACNGQLGDLFVRRLGNWVNEQPANAEYVKQLFQVLSELEGEMEQEEVADGGGEDDGEAEEDAA